VPVPRNITVVAVHGAWADGSSWQDVILPIQREGLRVIAAPIPLTSLSDDSAALKRAIARTEGSLILAAHAYAGAVVATLNEERVKALVYIAALAPDEGETLLKSSTVMNHILRRRNSPRTPRDSSGCLTKASNMLSPSTQRQNKLHYRQLSRGRFR